MKYIVLKAELNNGLEQRIPIIFPNFLVHDHVAKYFAELLIREYKRQPEITVASAGEINFGPVTCYGKSESCKVSSDPGDDVLINMFDYTQGL